MHQNASITLGMNIRHIIASRLPKKHKQPLQQREQIHLRIAQRGSHDTNLRKIRACVGAGLPRREGLLQRWALLAPRETWLGSRGIPLWHVYFNP